MNARLSNKNIKGKLWTGSYYLRLLYLDCGRCHCVHWFICFDCVAHFVDNRRRWHCLQFFQAVLPFLPDFWASIDTTGKKGGFDWGERTEADKHRELVEHIRIQHMNEERNRR